MDGTTILCTCITVVGTIIVAYITHGIKKNNAVSNKVTVEAYEVIQKRLEEQTLANIDLREQVDRLDRELQDNNLRTMRLDLDRAIDTDPDNTMVIMEMAQKYFVDMHGNCYMSKKFQEWANNHNVNITGLFNKD